MKLDGPLLPQPRQGADAATLTCVYLVVLCVLPSGLVVQGIPLSITPATLIAIVMGLYWMCAQLSSEQGMAKGRTAVRLALFAFVASLLASYANGNYIGLPSDEIGQADRTMVVVVALIGLALLVGDGVRTRRRIDTVLRTVATGVAFMAFVGALQFVLDLDLTRYLVPPGLKFSTVSAGSVFERSGFRRVAGTTGNPIEFGVLCAMVLPISLYYGFRAKAAKSHAWHWYLCSALIASGPLFSVSRSAVLGVLVAGFVLILGWPWRRRLVALAVAGGFLGFAKLVFPGLIGTFLGLFSGISSDDSVSYRTQRYPIAAAEIEKNLTFGRGVGTWYFPKHFALDNQYLMTLIDGGLVGFIALAALYLVAIGTALRCAVRSRAVPERELALTLLASVVVPAFASVTFDLLSFRTLAGVLFVVIGVICALGRIARAEEFGPSLPVPVAAARVRATSREGTAVHV